MQTRRVRGVAGTVVLELLYRRDHPPVHVGRTEPNHDANDTAGKSGAQQAFPAKLPPPQYEQQSRGDEESRATGNHKKDVGEKQQDQRERPGSRPPPSHSRLLSGIAEKRKYADQKVCALKNVVLGRNSHHSPAPRQTWNER